MSLIDERERPYKAHDLKGKTKKELTDIIESQIERWPELTFNSSKTKKAVMIAKIVDNGFSLAVPPEVRAVQDPAPSPPHPGSEKGPEVPPTVHPRPVDLLIEDLREEFPNKFIQQLVLPSCGKLAAGEWLVDGNRLLSALQKSPSSLSGPVKLAVDDPKEPGWKRYFVKMTGSEALKNAPTFPAQLTVPEDSRLKIFVEHSGPMNIRKRERSPSDEHHGQPSGVSTVTPPKKRTSHPDQKDVDWLKELLSPRPGYAEFQASQNKKLTNKARVVFWQFAAQFSSEHFNKPSGAAERQGKSVKKVSIESALAMSATALSEAERMTKILEKFGQDGEMTTQEVMDQAGATSTDGHALIKFLDDWNKSHTD
ncbi:hypothetical protein GGX14DRAFT_554374 [Mycena pura]|uniref:Uncharacterized protein n=1 Tax=Mycena pura TaxID=153505 RepID=A0AAD7E4A4_9AGAR|nr:hypothetical protein GGX14DRAFT_554374 [Mycena pura]